MGLNKATGNMYDFLDFTWNTIKGACPHACTYCHPAGTQILMADFSIKDISKVEIGEKIIGLKKKGKGKKKGFYKFTTSAVVDVSQRLSKTIQFKTEDGEIRCTPEHPLMGSTELRNCSDWKAARAFAPHEHIRFVSVKDRSRFSVSQRLGYIKGIRDGDGCVFHHGKPEKGYLGFEIVCVSKGLSKKIRSEFLAVLGISLKDGIKRAAKGGWGNDSPMLHTRITRDVEILETCTQFQENDIEFAKGYLAGMIDTDGSVSGGSIRIAQSKVVNTEKYNHIITCCQLLGLEYRKEKAGIRILSSFDTRCNFIFDYGVFHPKKARALLLNYGVKGSCHSKILSMSAHNEEVVYNLQTECENFIANGFIVHNCYMRRWGKQKPVRFDTKELKEFDRDIKKVGEGQFIFVGSSCDMFAEEIHSLWIMDTLDHCAKYPNNRYLFQSKNPLWMGHVLIDYPQLKAVTCTTIETNRWYSKIMKNSPKSHDRAIGMSYITIPHYVTIEPILDFDLTELVDLIKLCNPLQVNIGADSGGNKLPEPSAEKVRALIGVLGDFTKVVEKKNLGRLFR